MEVIKRFLRKDIIVISEDEIDQIEWGSVKYCCVYLDIWGKFHLEINNKGFRNKIYNTNWWHLFVRQDKIFKKLPFQLLRACKAKPAADLIGARQFFYLRKSGLLIPSNVGIIPWEYMKERGDLERNPEVGEIRRRAFAELFKRLDIVAARLGAKAAYLPTSTIADEKMKKYGCVPITVTGWRNRLFNFIVTFPIRNVRVYLKKY